MRAALLLAAALLAVGACGGDDGSQQAKDSYRSYRSAEDERGEAESRLAAAIREAAGHSGDRDRAGALAAVGRAQEAADEIDRLLEDELEAAELLGAYEPTREDADRLGHGLGTTQAGLRLIQRLLEVATEDPFLEREESSREVSDLSRRSAAFSREGELEIRRADHGLAVTLGIAPRPDPLFDR